MFRNGGGGDVEGVSARRDAARPPGRGGLICQGQCLQVPVPLLQEPPITSERPRRPRSSQGREGACPPAEFLLPRGLGAVGAAPSGRFKAVVAKEK